MNGSQEPGPLWTKTQRSSTGKGILRRTTLSFCRELFSKIHSICERTIFRGALHDTVVVRVPVRGLRLDREVNCQKNASSFNTGYKGLSLQLSSIFRSAQSAAADNHSQRIALLGA